MAKSTSLRASILVCSLALIYTSLVGASLTELIDDGEIESIAQSVCDVTKGTHKQIGRITTINRLIGFFENLPVEHKLSSCRQRYANALTQLHEVISRSNENVCSMEKLALIEEFHKNYVAKGWKNMADKSGAVSVKAPKILVLFFLHYANEVSTTCKESLATIYQVNSEDKSELNTADLEAVEHLFKDFSSIFGATKSRGYSDIVLIWNQIDRMQLKGQNDYINETGKRVTFKSNNAESMETFQRDCIKRLKPLYGPLAVPVIRLIDLGYYLEGEPFAAQLSHNKDLKQLLTVAQLCEFMLQVRIVADETMESEDMILITKEEAKLFKDNSDLEEPIADAVSDAFNHNILANGDIIKTVNTYGASDVVKSLKSNIKARSSIFRHMLRSVTRQAKNKAKSMIGKLFYTEKSSNRNTFEKKDATPVINESVNQLEELDSEDGNEKGLARRKRDIFGFKDDILIIMQRFKKNIITGIFVTFGILIKWILTPVVLTIAALGIILCKLIYAPIMIMKHGKNMYCGEFIWKPFIRKNIG